VNRCSTWSKRRPGELQRCDFVRAELLPETRAAIAEAMPMLTGEFTRQELTVVGGLGVSAGS
jgi:hypothetical protein